MPWSTSQLAQLAGTTIKAVRHYHEIGLLDEPERKPNGYKQYQVAHLLRLLQITRLSGLGVPLAQIASLAHSDNNPDQAIRILDVELETTVDRLQRIRGELALILRHRAPPELPAGFGEVAGDLSAELEVLYRAHLISTGTTTGATDDLNALESTLDDLEHNRDNEPTTPS